LIWIIALSPVILVLTIEALVAICNLEAARKEITNG